MSKLNLLVYLNSYEDSQSSNSPSMSNFKWTREISSAPAANPLSESFSLAPGETKTLFSGARTLLSDNSTVWSLTLKPLSTNTYVLKATGGTLPNFRTPRSIGINATTEVTVSTNGPVLTFSAPTVVATFATFSGQVTGMTTNILITADNIGTVGNSVALSFNGTTDITTEIATWNGANPSNTITLTSGDGTQIPASGQSIALSGGLNAGTAMDTTAVVVGDYARIGDQFNQSNQGEYKIIAKSANSFSVENESGVNEGPILLGSTFATQIQIYSALGVQKGDTLVISSGFSVVSQGSYEITDVSANSLEFYFTNVLPQETGISTANIAIYFESKQLVYLESNKKSSLLINGSQSVNVEPFVINSSVIPGVFLVKTTVYSLTVTNSSTDVASLFLATVD